MTFSLKKRYTVPSVALFISVFLSWFHANQEILSGMQQLGLPASITSMLSLSGIRLGVVTAIIIILSVAGVSTGLLKSEKSRSFVGLGVGALTIIMVIISNWVVNQKANTTINELLGGLTSSSFHPGNFVSRGLGFYMALAMGLCLTLSGGYSLYQVSRLGSVSETDTGSKGLSQIRVPKINLTTYTLKFQRFGKLNLKGRHTKYIASGVAVIAVYLVAMWIFDVSHSRISTVKSFVSAVRAGDTSKVSSMLDHRGTALPVWDVSGFVKYYQKNDASLQNLVSPVLTDGSPDATTIQSVFGTSGSSDVYLTTKNMLGFRTFKLHLQTVSYKLSAPSGTTFSLDGKPVSKQGDLLPAQYPFKALLKTAMGPVTEVQAVDGTQGGNVSQSFDFSNDMLTVSSSDVSGSVQLTVNDKPAGKALLDSNNNNAATVGPLPIHDGDKVSVTISEPWGPYVETGIVQDGQVQLSADPTADLSTARAMAQVIVNYDKQDAADQVSGNYKPELKYLTAHGNQYSSISGDIGNGSDLNSDKLQYANFDPTSLSLTQNQDGATGLQISDSEFYNENGSPDQENDISYTMEYQNGQWLIDASSNSFNSISQKASDFQWKPGSDFSSSQSTSSN